MSLAFSVYNLTIDVDGALYAFAQIVDHLGLSNERVRVTGKNVRPRRLQLDRLQPLDPLFSGMEQFRFSVTTGDPLEATLHKAAPYVQYVRLASRDSLTVFSPQQEDLRVFAERFMGGARGKYGFGMDWNRPGSFCGYAHGFDDFQSLGGNLMGKTDAGHWGNLYVFQRRTFFDQPIIRDIYPVNLLTNAQLDRETPGGTVRDLILGHEEWGEITRLADNWFMWCVPPGEIGNVRQEFESRGLLKNRVQMNGTGVKPGTFSLSEGKSEGKKCDQIRG